jgi:hypothetical protein
MISKIEGKEIKISSEDVRRFRESLEESTEVRFQEIDEERRKAWAEASLRMLD